MRAPAILWAGRERRALTPLLARNKKRRRGPWQEQSSPARTPARVEAGAAALCSLFNQRRQPPRPPPGFSRKWPQSSEGAPTPSPAGHRATRAVFPFGLAQVKGTCRASATNPTGCVSGAVTSTASAPRNARPRRTRQSALRYR